MKIIVNAIPLLNIPTGIGRYIRELYSEIKRRHPDIEIKFFNGSGISDEMPVPPDDNSLWAFAVNIAWTLPPIVPYTTRIIIHEKRARNFYRLSKDFNVYHEPGFFPFKTPKSVRTVFTIHDISLITLPEYHPKERVLFTNRYFEQSLQHTDLVITPSEFTKKEIRKTFPFLNINIHPVHLGYDRTLFFKRPDSEIQLLKATLNLPDKYILFVGTSDPRKNIQCIFRALNLLPEHIKLVCTGWSGWDSKIGFNKKAKNNKVIFTGYVTDQILALLYSGARAFVYPSFCEGFGLPVLEAMACGCPVICSDAASLPEITGNAAIVCKPDMHGCFAQAIHKLFSSDILYETMSKKSLAQAEKFSWETCAGKTSSYLINDCI